MRTLFTAIRSQLIVIILACAVALRLPLLSGSFWLDEAAQALESQRPLSQQLNIIDDFQPPLLHYLVHFSMYLGRSEWWLRTTGALIPGLVTIFFTYKIGSLLWNKRTGAIAALLLSTSSFHIFYSQELRQYSLPAALATLSWFLLLKIWKKETRPTVSQLLLFTLITTLGLYASYLFPFLVLSQLLFVFIYQRKFLLKWLLSFTAAGMLFLPILPLFLKQLSAGTHLRTDLPGWESVVSFTQIKVIPLIIAKFVFGVSNVDLHFPFIAASLLIVVLITLLIRKHRALIFSSYTRVVLIWLVIPILLAFIISYFVPVLQPKRVLYCLPAFYILIAATTAATKKLIIRQPAVLLVGTVLIINIFTIYQYWTNPNLQRENWRSLIVEIETKYPTQSAALFAFPDAFAPWVWYANPSYPTFASGTVLTDSNPNLADDLKKVHQYNHVLLFEYLTDLTDPNGKLKHILNSYGYIEQGYFIYPNIGRVWIYSKPDAVISYTYK